MTLYEIDEAIRNCMMVDPETGEVAIDEDRLAELQMERGEKLENIALWIKDLSANAKAIRDEENSLAERRKAMEAKAERLTEWLRTALAGEKFETAKCRISYRKTKSVKITDQFLVPVEYCAITTVPNKAAVKQALMDGVKVPGAEIEEKLSMSIK